MNNEENLCQNEIKKPQTKYVELLVKAGFSEKEATVYELLLLGGQMGISKIMSKLSYKRGDLYYILYSLRDKGAIEQTIKSGKINFKPKDPYQLLSYLEAKKDSYYQATTIVESILPQMFSDYDLTMKKPAILYLHGLEGLRKVYSMIDNSGEKELLLMRSVFDNDTQEELDLIEERKKKENELGIRIKALAPLTAGSRESYLHHDEANMYERRVVQKSYFSMPTQFLIWGNSIAITDMRKNGVTTVIQNKEIVCSFRTIFEYIWIASEAYHKKIVAEWKATLD